MPGGAEDRTSARPSRVAHRGRAASLPEAARCLHGPGPGAVRKRSRADRLGAGGARSISRPPGRRAAPFAQEESSGGQRPDECLATQRSRRASRRAIALTLVPAHGVPSQWRPGDRGDLLVARSDPLESDRPRNLGLAPPTLPQPPGASLAGPAGALPSAPGRRPREAAAPTSWLLGRQTSSAQSATPESWRLDSRGTDHAAHRAPDECVRGKALVRSGRQWGSLSSLKRSRDARRPEDECNRAGRVGRTLETGRTRAQGLIHSAGLRPFQRAAGGRQSGI